MARWKSLLLAGALGCWPALGYAQATLPVPPAPPGNDLGIPALPPGAQTTLSVTSPSPVNASAPGRVTLADRGGRMYAGPDISGMPKPEGPGNMAMFTGFDGNGAVAAANGANCFAQQGVFIPQGPAGCDPCGTILPASGPSGFIVDAGLTYFKVRRSDPSVLYQTTTIDVNGNPMTISSQADYQKDTGAGFWAGAGYLTRDGWFGMITYRKYTDTVSADRITNDGVDPNLVIQYIGPGPLGSGAGGGDVPPGGFLDREFNVDWTNIDVMGGVVISPARCLDVIFAGGARLSKLEQNYNAFISRGDGTTNSQLLNSELEGAGPRIGIETRVYPVGCLMLYAKAYSNLLLTHRRELASTFFFDGVTTTTNNASFEREEVLPSIDMTLGMEVGLFGGRLLVGGGYDFNYLWEAGSTYTEQATNPRAARHVNLAIDGFVFHATWLW